MNEPLDVNMFLENLKTEKQKYDALLALSEKLEQNINNPDVNTIMQILATKHQIVEEIEQIEQNLVPYKQEWEQFQAKFTEEQRGEAKKLIQEISSILQKLISNEEKHLQILLQRKPEISLDLQNLQQKKKAIKTYLQHPETLQIHKIIDDEG